MRGSPSRTARLVVARLRPSARRLSTAQQLGGADTSTAWASLLDVDGVAAAKAPRTHAVENQAPSLSDYDAFAADPSLQEALTAASAEWAAPELHRFGAIVGSAEWQEHSRLANAFVPRLHTHDRHGRHCDVVEYHPSYHKLMRLAVEAGIAGGAWRDERPGALTARGVAFHLMYQLEQGTCCPVTMTFAAHAALGATRSTALAHAWLPKLSSARYDERDVALDLKAGATVGMSMTEKQGGSDVRPAPDVT
jgi:putative acyl-CoA dehydrogenase